MVGCAEGMRRRPSAAIAMHSSSAASIRRLKDSVPLKKILVFLNSRFNKSSFFGNGVEIEALHAAPDKRKDGLQQGVVVVLTLPLGKAAESHETQEGVSASGG